MTSPLLTILLAGVIPVAFYYLGIILRPILVPPKVGDLALWRQLVGGIYGALGVLATGLVAIPGTLEHVISMTFLSSPLQQNAAQLAAYIGFLTLAVERGTIIQETIRKKFEDQVAHLATRISTKPTGSGSKSSGSDR